MPRLLQSQTEGQTISSARLLRTLAAAIVLAATAGTLCWFGLRGLATSSVITTQLVVVVVYLVLAATFALSFTPMTLAPIEFRFTSVRHLWLAVFAWLITVCIALLIYVLIGALGGGLLTPLTHLLSVVTDLRRLTGQSDSVWFIAIIRSCFLVPLFEELFFRGLLVPWLQCKVGGPYAIALSAMLFSLMHVYPIALAYTFLFGLSTAYVRLRTASTLNSYIMHVLNNLLFVGGGVYLFQRTT